MPIISGQFYNAVILPMLTPAKNEVKMKSPLISSTTPSPEVAGVNTESNTASFLNNTGKEFISVPELAGQKDIGKEQTVFIFDLRNSPDFNKLHIKNALNLPEKYFEEIVKNSDWKEIENVWKGHRVILYCEGTCENQNIKSYFAEKSEVQILLGGFSEWRDKGYPTERTAD